MSRDTNTLVCCVRLVGLVKKEAEEPTTLSGSCDNTRSFLRKKPALDSLSGELGIRWKSDRRNINYGTENPDQRKAYSIFGTHRPSRCSKNLGTCVW